MEKSIRNVDAIVRIVGLISTKITNNKSEIIKEER